MIRLHSRFGRGSLVRLTSFALALAASAGSAHAQTATASAPSGETAQPAPTPAPSGGYFSGAKVFVLGDGYSSFNTNRPPDDQNLLRNFDTHSHSVRLSYVEGALERKATDDKRLGFRFDIGAGTDTVNLVGGAEPGPKELKYLQQAYVSVLAPIGSGLTIDVGKFVTPAGAEVIETQDNWNYSRGILFAWAIPYYHAGVRASYVASDKVSVTGFVLNGWNDVQDRNDAKSFAAQIAVKPGDRVSVIGTWIGGEEQVDADGWRHLVDAVVSVTVSDKVKLLANADYARDRGLGPDVRWYGVSGALRAQLSPKWSISPRLEWFADPQGASTGVAQDITDATLTVERMLAPGLLIRAEYRVDRSTEHFFPSASGDMRRTQQTIGVGLLYGWSR